MLSNIASERRRLGISQKELAERIGVSESTIGRWERGSLTPYGSELTSMHILFGCSTDYLLGLTEERKHFELR